jgi:hemerythrin
MSNVHRDSSVGVRLLDCDHREIVEIFDEVERYVAAGNSMQRVSRLLNSLTHISLSHFALEESMMLATRFPGLELHRLEHQWLDEQTRTLETRLKRTGINPDDMMLKFLAQSHIGHIQHGDLKFGSWLGNTPIGGPAEPALAENESAMA